MCPKRRPRRRETTACRGREPFVFVDNPGAADGKETLNADQIGYTLGIVWIVATASGAMITAFNFRDAVLDYLFVRNLLVGNGRRVLARVAVINEGTRWLVHSLFLASAIWLHLWKHPNGTATVSLFVRSCVVLSLLLLTVQSVLLRYVRSELRELGLADDSKSSEGEPS